MAPKTILGLTLCLLANGCATPTTTKRLGLPPLQVVKQRLDLQRFSGTWYEIARFPHAFEGQCAAATFSYNLQPDGLLKQSFRCRLGSPVDGRLREGSGLVRVVDKARRTKLEVISGPFVGAAWIVILDAEYRHVVIGEPGRDYVWILAREPSLPDETLEDIVQELSAKGYEVTRLKSTVHQPEGDVV
jgi:apolipoprotein D and lipocalin family protein